MCIRDRYQRRVRGGRGGSMRHNDLALMAVFLLALACRTEAQTPSVQPVHDMLVRVLGASTKQQVNFDLRLDPSMRQGFKLFSPSTAANVTAVSVVASGLPELAFGAGYYLRTSAAMSFSWMRTGGNNVQPPSSGFAPVPVLVERYKKVKWSYYQNVCTGSYSMWWWDWDRWEKEIDWMALWGVNLVLAYTGQEQLYKQVYNDLGVNDTILERTFDGPAFLTWSRGQGSFGFGGPLPASFMESQVALNVKIMTRLKLLGMHGILPGFQGNVPKELPAIFPGANSSGGWLDGLDPLFHTVARALAAQVVTEFGGSDFIEADGWFSLETGPWLSTLSSSSSDHRAPNSSRDSVPCEFGGVPFVVPSESEAYVRGRSVFADLTSGSPNATWVYQGYPWFRVWDVCPQSRVALRGFVKGFTDAIPNNKLLVLDLVADGGGDRAIWRYPVDPDTGVKFTRNASIIWCALNNWGGAVHLGGDLSFVMTETSDFFAGMGDQAAGVGLTPEGIDNSPAYFSMVLDSPWTTQPTASDWLQEWGEGRCGNPGVAAAQQAYQLLFETVYRPGQQYLWCCSKPVFCPTALPGDDLSLIHISEPTRLLSISYAVFCLKKKKKKQNCKYIVTIKVRTEKVHRHQNQ
eukprot:TRINITY_DN14485_c0_g1_i2.p1 TRINITY_DN14485_c0_g1~~TRINITY_DN14485_c0_g1_i2.p1  ORF type:complete len:632 (-),score=131.10 TRINITY_DN14485_c0_g1_i2:4-1899(-)